LYLPGSSSLCNLLIGSATETGKLPSSTAILTVSGNVFDVDMDARAVMI